MKRFINILLYVVCIFLLISCEIGLGAAVDTEAPTVAITSPQAGSVIRDSFAVKGSWSDDGAISSIKVTLESTSNFIEPIVYDATVNLDEGSLVSGTWYCEINPESEGIIDGEYKASVVISDFGGHTTTIPSYLLTVDNTAPLIVLQRPATKVNETADAYGQTFTLEGIGADDNSINKIDLNIYTDAECTNLVKTVSKSNVPASINLELATFEENTQNEYSDIYGSTTSNGTIVRYFKLIAYDSAKTYPLEGEGSELGNSTSTYYLYDDIYESVLGSYNATTIYQMLNGTYLATDASRTAASVSSVVKSLSENELNISKFSLNPRNNPKFSVSGRESLGDSEINLDASSYELTNGSEVVIEVSTGLDGISLNGSSLRPYVLPCGVNASLSVADTAENRIYLAEAGSGSKSGTSYKFVVTLDNAATAANTDVKLDVDSITPYYLFGVEGQDVKGNAVVANGNGYAIKFVSNGAAPDLSALQTSTDGSTWSSDSVVYIGKGKDLYIKGTVTVETGLASLAVFKDKTSNPTAICQDGSTTEPHTMYTSAVEGGQSSFEYKIDKSNFDQNVTKQYAIRLEATKNKTSSSTVTVRYDVEGPTIKNFMASPYTSDSTGDTRGLLNGTVTFSGLLSDAYSGLSSSNASWKVQKKDSLSDASWKDVAGLTGTISDPSEFSFTVDTTSVEPSATSIKYMRLVITAYDEAGNKSEITYDYTVDQSTDRPTVLDDGTTLNTSLSYADLRANIATTVNKITKASTVTFKLNDDDGFKDSTDNSSGIVIKSTKNSTDGTADFTPDSSTERTEYISIAGNPTGPTITYDLPDVEGSYKIELILTDKYGTLSTATNTYTFYVQLTGNAPTVSMSNTPSYVTTNAVSGLDETYAKTEYTTTLTITEGSAPFTATRTNPDSSVKTLTVPSGTPPVKITDTFEAPTSEDGTVTYTITDTYGKAKTLHFDYKLDNHAPKITISNVTETSLGTNKASHTFTGNVDDLYNGVTLSGVAKVEVDFDRDHSIVDQASGNPEWTYIARFSELNLTEGSNNLYARAVDNVGNGSKWTSCNFMYDVSNPEGSITKYTDVDSIDHILSSTSFDYGYKFSLSGRAYDSNALATVKLVQTKVGGAADGSDQVTTITTGLSVSNNEWTFENLPRASDGTNFAADPSTSGETKAESGTYKYYVVVKDAAEKESQSVEYTVTVDNTPPTLTLDSPSKDLSGEDSLSGNSYTFKATSTDASGGTGSQYIYYKFDSDSEYTQASIDDGVQWKLTKTLGTGTSGSEYDFYEGQHTISVYSVDKAGNKSKKITRTFYVDQAAPVVIASASHPVNASTNPNSEQTVTISGSVTETHGIKSFTINGEDCKSLIQNGGSWTYTNKPESDGTYTYKIIATDNAERKYSLTKTVIVDTGFPSIRSITVKNTTITPDSDNSSVWFGSKILSVVVKVTDNTDGSGIASVEYVVLDSDSEANATSLADSEWTAMSLDTGANYKSSVIFDSDGENQKLYIRAIDGAGNVKYFNTDSTDASLDEYARHVPVQINIDTSTPDLSANYYQVGSGNVKAVSGSVYTNGSSPITVYGNYSDGVSGIQALTFKLGETTISPTVTYSTSEITSVYNITGRAADAAQGIDAVTTILFNVNESGESGITTENNKTIRSWKAVFTPSAELFGDESSRENKSLKLSVSGSNNASLPSSISPFNIVYDSTEPELSNLALATSSTSYSVYQPSSTEFSYYVNNTDGTFTISGNSSDSSGIDTVKVQLFKASNTSTTADLSNTFSDTAAYVWSYSGINIADWTDTSDTSDTRAVITATDNAGNSTSKEMTLKFDTSAPTVSHGLDAKNKDLYLRVGSNDNDDIDSSSTNPQWDEALDTDVGGKYSSATYGNALTMQIRGYFEDETGGSGASKVYYYVTQNEPTQTGNDLKSLVLASPTGTITKLSTEQEKRVFYNVTADATDTYGGTLFSEGADYDKYYKTIPSNFSESLSGFATGKNYLVFVVTDNVGNSRLDTCSDGTQSYNYFTINIDQIGPVITTNTTDIMYSNGGSDNILLSGTVTDADAGVKSLSISVTTSQVNTYTATLGNSNTWTASVPNSIFASLSGNYTLTATAVDKAGTGNTSTLPVATILVDTTAPTLTLNSPTDADTSTNTTEINGRISLGGSASDANGLSTSDNLTLYYTWSDTIKNKTDANLVPSDFGTDAKSQWVKISSISAVNNWTFNNINTASLEKEYEENETPKTTLYLMASAKDKAGNTGYSNRVTAIVDQDSDRPIIKFTNLELSTKMASSTPLPFASNSLYGSVTDDDGIISIKYKIGEDGEFTTVSGSNGSFNISLSDGSKKLSFEVTDCESVVLSEKPDDWNTEASTLYYTNKECTTAASTTFQSGTYYLKKTFTSSSNDSYNQATPKLTDSNGNKYAYRDSTSGKKISVTYLKVDTKKPDVLSLEYTKTPYDESSWSTTASTYGGKNANNFYIRQFAYDANGIADSKVETNSEGETTIEKDTYGTRLKVEKKANENAVTGYTAADDNYYYYALKAESSTREQNGKTYTEWRSSVVNTDGMESGNRNVIFEVFDGTSSTETEAIIVIDNTCPVISVSAPDSSQNSKGNVTAYGETDLTDWKKTSTSTDYTEHMYYALSFDGSTIPATDNSESALANVTAITSWKDDHNNNGSSTINYKPYYSEIIGGSFSWYVYFDGGQTTTASHDVTFKQFLINSGVTTQALIESTNPAEKFTTVVKAYLWIKAVDEVGNSTVVKHEILIDPQGDAPTVTLAYPESSGTTLGGEISLRGIATDDYGNTIGVDSVWVQIISAIENGYDSSTVTSTGKQTFGGLSFDDTVTSSVSGDSTTYSHAYTLSSFAPTMKDVHQWIEKGYKVYTNITSDTPTQVTSASASDESGADYYIKATLSGSAWSLAINGSGEFNPAAGKLNPIAYRIFAKDKDNNLSRYQQQLSVYDSDTPVISGLYLRQYSDNTNGTGTVTASRAYQDDMWVKGTWWLYGTVEDTQGLSSLKVGPATSKVNQTITGNAAAKETFNYLLSTGSGVGSLALVIEASDKASPVHSIIKKLVINYDNTPPELVTSVSDFNISSTVQNSNGFYSFGSKVTENVVDSYSQSGFAYLAFWFERKITGKHVVYDVMRSKANSEIEYAALTSDSGLMWKSVSVGRSSSSLGTLTLSALDPNIHVGGLCKIAGSIYLISSVSADGLTIGIDGQPEYTAATETALFAIANVVNNNVESGSGTKSTIDGLYGYYSSISNDDGDHMVESVSKSGTSWNWEANINSQNMADGSVTLHYAAFDNAGNYVEGSVSGNVANNAPRIASLEVWSDFNENGSKDSGEYETKYYQGKERKIGGVYTTRASKVTDELVVSGNDNDYNASGSAFMTVKATTRFTPELIGGNGALYYSYKYGTSSTLASATTYIGSDSIGDGTDNGIDETIDNEGYYIQDQNGLGYINGSTSAYMEIPGPGTGYTLSALGNSTSSTEPTWFEYTIYDSTEGSGTWSTTSLDSTNRLSAKFRVALNVQYNDTKPPVVKIRPFYWNSKTENSVCWTSDSTPLAEGHIELEADITNKIADLTAGTTALGSDDPKVSGKIKIEGYAFDDIKLNSLYGIVSNHTNLSTATGTLLSTYNGAWTSTAYSEDTGWGFEAEDVYCNGDGHLVKWTLTIDTAKRTTAAQLDQTVVVYAKDDRSDAESAHSVPTQTSLTSYVWNNVKDEDNALTTYYTDFYCNTPVNSSTSATAIVYKADDMEKMTSYYKMDIVPYISKVYTRLAKNKNSNWSVYNRTALGHYPVQSVVSNIDSSITLKTSTSEDVVIYGFNLNDSSATFTSGSNTFTVGNETDTLLSITNNTAGQLSFNVAKLQTGKLNLKVNDISILNNINDDDAAGDASEAGDAYKNWYNRQGNGDTNNILTDDVYFDVWEFNDRAATPINGLATGINMEINQKTGMLNYAFANGGLYYSMGGNSDKTTAYSTDNSYSSIYWAGDWDTFAGPCVGFHVDELGYTYSLDSGGDTNKEGSVDKWVLYSSRWGLGKHDNTGTLNGTNSLRLEEIALKTGGGTYDYSLMKYRFLSPEFASTVSGTSTNLYLVYYDALTNQIRFRAGTFTKTEKEQAGGFQDEYTNGESSYYKTNNCQVIANGTAGATFKTSATKTTTVSGIKGRGSGQYVDVAVVKNGTTDVVCVVWYDAEENKMKFSYISDPIGNWDTLKGDATAKNWETPQTIFTEGGEYCHIVADKYNHLHIAAYAGNGDVMYAYLGSYRDTAQTCTVDASGAVGEHLTLDVAVNSKGNSIPYIGYYTSAIKFPKYAYLVDPTVEDSTATFTQVADGADSNEQFTGAWEVAVVPSPSRMTTNREDKVNIGVWKNSGDLTDSKVGGAVKNSSHSAIGSSGYSATNWSKTFGNGTSNGILGYQITTSSGSCLETAQMR